MEQIYDLIIIGGGAAGLSTAICAQSKGLSALLITTGPDLGGQLLSIESIENYPGFPSLSGAELASMLKEHCELSGIEVIFDTITSIDIESGLKTVFTATKDYSSVGLVIATGEFGNANTISGLENMIYDKNIKANEDCRTTASDVYVVGNARMKPYHTILSAISDGIFAINSYLDDIK